MMKTKKGFTLIELIVVVVVLAVLAAVAVPMVSGWVKEAEYAEMQANARTLEVLSKAKMIELGITKWSELGNWRAVDLILIELANGGGLNTVLDGEELFLKGGAGYYQILDDGRVTADWPDPSDSNAMKGRLRYIEP